MQLSLGLAPADPLALRELADAVSDPDDPRCGAHLGRDALARLVLGDEHAALARWLVAHGMRPLPLLADPSLPLPPPAPLDEHGLRSPAVGAPLRLACEPAQLRAALGERAAARLLARDPPSPAQARDCLPRRWAGLVDSVHLERAPQPAWMRPLAFPRGPALPLASPLGLTPAALRARYGAPPAWSAAGETIAVMALGGVPDLADLEAAWSAWDVAPPELHARQLGAAAPSLHPLHRFETTMSLAWLGALAPGARLVVYFIDPATEPDPWASFLRAVIADDRLRPTVATTSWSCPEHQYYRVHGRATITCLLDQVTALGVTVLASSGDWGVLAGPPRPAGDGRPVCGAAWPRAVFPAVEPRVLAVGGTTLRGGDEVAWNIPLSPPLRRALALERLSSGGGFSEHAPIPAWQRDHLRPAYARGDEPAVIPDGRGYPDVAMLAGGDDDSALAIVLDGRWRDDAGGTSLAAPLWAAWIAGLNHARRSRGRPRLGSVNPRLYRLADTAFAPVLCGDATLAVPTLDRHGRATPRPIAGYHAGPGWNPVTGLGAPRIDALLRLLAD